MRPGDVLRHERKQKGLSLERAARESRIKSTLIEAIETGETAHIPAVYLKGYVRNYARYLDIDPGDIEERIDDIEGDEPQVRSVFPNGPGTGDAQKWLKISSYLAASVLIAALAWQFTHEAARFTQPEPGLASIQDGETAEQAADNAAPGRTHMNASLANVDAIRNRGELAGSHAAEEAWAALENPAAPEGQHSLVLETSADTWVEIFGADDQELEMDLIRAGSSRAYRGAGPFRVMIGRASAVVMTLDGEPVDLGPHTHGNVASLILARSEDPAEADADESTENH
jgi:cytoskeleton protein RodZ